MISQHRCYYFQAVMNKVRNNYSKLSFKTLKMISPNEQPQEIIMSTSEPGSHQKFRVLLLINTVVPSYQLIQHPRFQLPAVYRGPKKNWKIKEIISS
jgi:hypothetical protein